MRLFAQPAALLMAGSLALSGCATNEQTGQLLGALAGAGLGKVLAGDDDDTVVALAVLAGAGIGAWIGGNIGRGLDDKERRRLAMSTKQALDMPVPANSPLRRQSADASPELLAGAPSVEWTSPTHPDTVSGKTTVMQVKQSSAGECRTIRQQVLRNGQKSFEDATFCRADANSPWSQT